MGPGPDLPSRSRLECYRRCRTISFSHCNAFHLRSARYFPSLIDGECGLRKPSSDRVADFFGAYHLQVPFLKCHPPHAPMAIARTERANEALAPPSEVAGPDRRFGVSDAIGINGSTALLPAWWPNHIHRPLYPFFQRGCPTARTGGFSCH